MTFPPPILRHWKESDFAPFAQMNADPEVMRHFLSPLSPDAARIAFEKIRATLEGKQWGVWAVEYAGEFAGMTGLNVPQWTLPFSPCTEILWRLRPKFWGKGIAFQAAQQALQHGFQKLDLPEIVAFTTPPNRRSIRLMERLEFRRDAREDFDHPAVPVGHPLRRHVLYRKRNPFAPVAE